jgi:hypothetical protein
MWPYQGILNMILKSAGNFLPQSFYRNLIGRTPRDYHTAATPRTTA